MLLNPRPIPAGQYFWTGFNNKSFSEFQCIFQEVKLKENFSDKLRQNNCRFFHVLAHFYLTRCETELELYLQKVNIRVNQRVPERIKTYRVLINRWISRNFLKCLNLIARTLLFTQKANWIFVLETCKKIGCRICHRKTYFTLYCEFLYNLFSMMFWENTIFISSSTNAL